MAELDFTGGNSEAARLSRELASARAGAQRLSQQIAEINAAWRLWATLWCCPAL